MPDRGKKAARVGCVIVNYRSPREMLEQCLDSIVVANADIPCSIVLVDNASGDGVFEQIAEEYPGLVSVQMGRNAGFAAAVNRGLKELSEPFVLMLNTDAVLEPGSLALMADALDTAGGGCAGVAPKMMLSAHENILDAIGTVMPDGGASFNRGIGQCDLGQYDHVDEVFGVCFGATLLRRELFAQAVVGPLYEGYFLYFEDSDWCLRARSLGYAFITAPAAVVQHLHSGVARNETLSFKYKLIELNTMKLVIRTFESPVRAVSVVAGRSARLLARTFIRRAFIHENLATLASLITALPGLLKERRELKRRRTTSDRHFFQLAQGEDAYFDTVEYVPQHQVESLIATYLRLRRRDSAVETGEALSILYRLQQESAAGATPRLTAADREILAAEPECVLRLLDTALTGS